MNQLESLSTAALKRGGRSRGNLYPLGLFDQVTDILADLVLEDLKQYPRIPTKQPIDSLQARENTALTPHQGGT